VEPKEDEGSQSAEPPSRGGEEAESESKPRRSPVRIALQVLAVTIIAALVGLLVQQTLAREGGPRLVSDVKAGDKPFAPQFELPALWPRAATWPPALRPALADGRISLRELGEYPVVMNFWASWCTPCRAEAPRLVASARKHMGAVVFLGVNVQDFESDARRFLERYQTNYVSVRDDGDSTYRAYGLTGLPETYFLDRRGRIVAHSVGEVSVEELEANVRMATAS
jgi:cytochrome c biogenesis protein CcmG, thiol:disulfide interchange protein DsbE